MRQTSFIVERPDGFIGVEVNINDQLTPEEALEFARRLTHTAELAQRRVEALRESTMRLIWYQRADGRWNAECTCGSSIVGVVKEVRQKFEEHHIKVAAPAGRRRDKRPECGPKLPELDPNDPSPRKFA